MERERELLANNYFDEFFEDGALDHPPFVEATRHVVKVDDHSHIFSQLFDQPNIYICFQQCSAYFF